MCTLMNTSVHAAHCGCVAVSVCTCPQYICIVCIEHVCSCVCVCVVNVYLRIQGNLHLFDLHRLLVCWKMVWRAQRPGSSV